jgi:hypothetical protein
MIKRFRVLVALFSLLAALPGGMPAAAALPTSDSPLCPAGSTWVDMDDPERHTAALDRAALSSYDANGDAQTCVRPVADEREGNLRLAYKVADLGEAKAAGGAADCPDDTGPIDMHKPEIMPFPLTREILTHYDLNGDGQLCVSGPLLDEGDFTIDVYVVDNPVLGYWCGGQLATIIGTPQDDWMNGTPGDDIIVGLDGDDEIAGKEGNDIICGGEGEDEVEGDDGDDTLYGGEDDDDLKGDDGDDTLYGGAGNDRLNGDYVAEITDGGNDTLYGGAGEDNLKGAGGDDDLFGDEGNDYLFGNEGNDFLRGGADDDDLFGNDGDDELFAGGGSDRLDGGASMDECWGALATTTFISCELPDRHR